MILILEFVNYSIISPVDPVVDPSLNRVSSYVIPPTGHNADKCELVFEVLHINTPAHSKHKHQNPKRHSSCENWKLVREGCQKNSCEKSGLLPNLPRPPSLHCKSVYWCYVLMSRSAVALAHQKERNSTNCPCFKEQICRCLAESRGY